MQEHRKRYRMPLVALYVCDEMSFRAIQQMLKYNSENIVEKVCVVCVCTH